MSDSPAKDTTFGHAKAPTPKQVFGVPSANAIEVSPEMERQFQERKRQAKEFMANKKLSWLDETMGSGHPIMDEGSVAVNMIDAEALKKGGILVCRAREEYTDGELDELAQQISKCLDDFGHDNVLVAVIRRNEKLEFLDDKGMEEHGWVRKTEPKRGYEFL